MLSILVESAGHLRELCDAAAGDPAGRAVCLDLIVGEEPTDGIELELLTFDPTDPTMPPGVYDDLADDVATLPPPAVVPRVHDAAAVDDLIGAHRAGAAAARAAWSTGYRNEPSGMAAAEDCAMLLRGADIEPKGEAMRVALVSYQSTLNALRAQNGGAS